MADYHDFSNPWIYFIKNTNNKFKIYKNDRRIYKSFSDFSLKQYQSSLSWWNYLICPTRVKKIHKQ